MVSRPYLAWQEGWGLGTGLGAAVVGAPSHPRTLDLPVFTLHPSRFAASLSLCSPAPALSTVCVFPCNLTNWSCSWGRSMRRSSAPSPQHRDQEQQTWAEQGEVSGFHAPAHHITSLLHAGYLLSISLPPRGLKEISRAPPAELRIPSTIHSGAAGRPGINRRGNAVNSSELFLSLAQLVAGTVPHESRAVTIHHRYLCGCIPGSELASFGSSGAASSRQVMCRRNPNPSTPRWSSFQAIFRKYQTLQDKIGVDAFLNVRPQHRRHQRWEGLLTACLLSASELISF